MDVGCGLGGAARYVASKLEVNVTGIDLTSEYIETGNSLCNWLNLDGCVSLEQGNALSMPYEDNSFDGGYMLHVGMNIDDKTALFSEIFRVLKPGGAFGIYDIMRQKEGELTYPVPWAKDNKTSKLETPVHYKTILNNIGFEIAQENNRRDFSLEFFKKLRENAETRKTSPALGLHILMQENTSNKITNMINGITNGVIAPVEIIVIKK